MAVIKVPTNFNIDLEFEVPEFYKRLIALLVDFLIMFFYIKIASAILEAIVQNSGYNSETWTNMGWFSIFLILGPVLFYHLIQEILMNGQSIGKKMLSLRVVDEHGGKASFSQFLVRWLLREVWFLILLIIAISYDAGQKKFDAAFLYITVLAYFIVDIVLVVSSQKGQRLGDILARTIIISTSTKSHIEETVFREVADNYTPSFPQIMQLSDKDMNAIKNILENARRKGDFHMAEVACDKIKTHLKIQSSLGPFDFLDVVLKDYNYLSSK
ncbi:MAG: RDD family protein [Chitinophagaceae bacterium]|nr:RDD family protein [Chitinophagaceae bacterium]